MMVIDLELLEKMIAVLSARGYRAADYNGSGVWRILGEIAATGVHEDVMCLYYYSTEKDKWDFVRLFDQWRKGDLH